MSIELHVKVLLIKAKKKSIIGAIVSDILEADWFSKGVARVYGEKRRHLYSSWRSGLKISQLV